MEESFVDINRYPALRPSDASSAASRSRNTSPLLFFPVLDEARSPADNRTPVAASSCSDEDSDTSSDSPSENSHSDVLPSRSNSRSRSTSPLASPLATTPSPSPRAPAPSSLHASSPKPTLAAPALQPPAPLSLRQSCKLVAGTVAVTLGAMTVAHRTQGVWLPPAERLLVWSQQQLGVHVVNPATEALSTLALRLSRFGYHPPMQPVPLNPVAEWYEIARRVERLGQAFDAVARPGPAWLEAPLV